MREMIHVKHERLRTREDVDRLFENEKGLVAVFMLCDKCNASDNIDNLCLSCEQNKHTIARLCNDIEQLTTKIQAMQLIELLRQSRHTAEAAE